MSIVYYSQNLDRQEFATKVINTFLDKIKSCDSFLIKPNLVSGDPYPTTTHPQMVQAVIQNLLGLGKRDIVVADGPATDAGSSYKIIQNHPIKKVCDYYGVDLVNLYSTKSRKIISPRHFPLRLFSLPLEKDLVISLPVLKEHSCCGLTGALKNQFGYLPRRERLALHGLSRLGKDILSRGIAEINVSAKPDLVIMDGVETLLGCQELRHGGKVAHLGYLMAGEDPVSLDSFGFRILQKLPGSRLAGLSIDKIGHLVYSAQYGVGNLDFTEERW